MSLEVDLAATITSRTAPNRKSGNEEVTLVVNTGESGSRSAEPACPCRKASIVPPSTATGTKVSVYNLDARKKANRRCSASSSPAKSQSSSRPKSPGSSDFHESFTIELPNAGAAGLSTLISRLVNNGATTGNGTYINNPTTCFNPTEPAYEHLYSTWFRAESYGTAERGLPDRLHAVRGEGRIETNAGGTEGALVQQTGCDTVPFTPGLNVDAGTAGVDSPAPATVETTLKYLTGAESARAGVAPAQGGRRAARRDGPEPVRLGRPRRMHRCPVQEGRAHLRQRLPGELEDRHASRSNRRRWRSR